MTSLSHSLPASPTSFLLTDNCYPKCCVTPQHISRSSTDVRRWFSHIERRLKPKTFLRKNWSSQRTFSVTGQEIAVAVDTCSYFSQNLSFLLQFNDRLEARSPVGTKQSSSCCLNSLKWEKCPLSRGIYCTCSCYTLYPQCIQHCPKHHP